MARYAVWWPAESYLTHQDQLGVTWGAMGVTVALILVAMILVWLAVLLLSSAGRSVSASLVGLPEQLATAQSSFINDLLNWQTWSTLLATFSSLVILLIGFVARLSGWILEFHRWVREWLKKRSLYRRTYRHWEV
jgi:uncharacterized membrane protein